ncbi:hypothetical protein IQ255_13885 [Pleurocapsales cyanobacterium LEGE 10410]|nr:hypothetical protein [Pleurocapsales cyanobacterium LEGE 10410]
MRKVLSQSTEIEEAIQKVENALDATELITEPVYLSLINRQASSTSLVLQEVEQIKVKLNEAIESLVEISKHHRD